MAKRIKNTTPKQDGFRMPGEFEKQKQIWMLWPWRNDNWRLGAKPAQKAFLEVAEAISEFEPVSLCVRHCIMKMLWLAYQNWVVIIFELLK